MPATLKRPNPKKLGQQRLGVLKKIKSRDQFEKLWKKPAYDFPFELGDCWKHVAQYAVKDYAAEVGFFMDVLGFPTNAVMDNYMMFTGPDKDFTFAVVPAKKGKATPPASFALEFLVRNLYPTVAKLKARGVKFTQDATPLGAGSNMATASFKTPNGIPITLWSILEKPSCDCGDSACG